VTTGAATTTPAPMNRARAARRRERVMVLPLRQRSCRQSYGIP
jgi:hypothetical protein